MARLLQEKGIPTAFGGRVFNHISGLASRIPAHFLGNTIESAIPMIEKLMFNPTSAPAEAVIEKRIGQTVVEYKEKRSMIERYISEYLQSHNRTVDYVDIANHFLGNTFIAALELGDISYASTDIHWLTNLLTEQNIPVSVLPFFLDLYAQAIREVMSKAGQPIYEWLMIESQKIDM
jgi:hypothetical protein